jgi:hypothetical protein
MEFDLDLDNPAWRKWALGVCRRRCPELSEKELAEATQNLLDYMKVVWRMYKRQEAEGTLDEWRARLHAERMEVARQGFLADFRDLLFYRAEAKNHELMTHAVKPRNR